MSESLTPAHEKLKKGDQVIALTDGKDTLAGATYAGTIGKAGGFRMAGQGTGTVYWLHDEGKTWRRWDEEEASSLCRSRGCGLPPWPTFDGVCFDHGMFPETVRT